jgi:hypothetical protein
LRLDNQRVAISPDITFPILAKDKHSRRLGIITTGVYGLGNLSHKQITTLNSISPYLCDRQKLWHPHHGLDPRGAQQPERLSLSKRVPEKKH